MNSVVTCILENNGDILLLKRSKDVGTYKGLWGGVAGFIEEGIDPYETALKEIKEEVGIDKKHLFFVKKLNIIRFKDFYENKIYNWVVYPFLFHINNRNLVEIDWEHVKFKWINPSDIGCYDTVPRFDKIVIDFFSLK